jgi:hypothetical protein
LVAYNTKSEAIPAHCLLLLLLLGLIVWLLTYALVCEDRALILF